MLNRQCVLKYGVWMWSVLIVELIQFSLHSWIPPPETQRAWPSQRDPAHPAVWRYSGLCFWCSPASLLTFLTACDSMSLFLFAGSEGWKGKLKQRFVSSPTFLFPLDISLCCANWCLFIYLHSEVRPCHLICSSFVQGDGFGLGGLVCQNHWLIRDLLIQ